MRDFVGAAFGKAGLDWRQHVTTDGALLQKVQRGPLRGDSCKLARVTGWTTRTTIEQIAGIMVDAERAKDKLA